MRAASRSQFRTNAWLTFDQPCTTIIFVPRHIPLSDQIRAAIEASELSRAEICRRIGLDKAVMSRFMSGQGGLAMTKLDRLGRVLGLRIECRPNGRRPR